MTDGIEVLDTNSVSTPVEKRNFEVIENQFSKEQFDAMVEMQLHDVMKVDLPFDETLIIIRVPNGYLYRKANQIPVFVPKVKSKKYEENSF